MFEIYRNQLNRGKTTNGVPFIFFSPVKIPLNPMRIQGSTSALAYKAKVIIIRLKHIVFAVKSFSRS